MQSIIIKLCKFWCFSLVIWSPKQSKIEESSLESMAKQWKTVRIGYAIIWIGRPDTPSEGGGTWVFFIRKTYPDRGARRHYIRLPPLSTRMYHIRNSVVAAIPSGYFASSSWKGEAFQLPRLDISGSSDSVPGEFCSHFAQCRGVLLKLPDMCDRQLGYFGIFCFRYLLSKSPNSPCNPPIIGFLSY